MEPFKCLYSVDLVTDCPPVQELDRLRGRIRQLEQENRELREKLSGPEKKAEAKA